VSLAQRGERQFEGRAQGAASVQDLGCRVADELDRALAQRNPRGGAILQPHQERAQITDVRFWSKTGVDVKADSRQEEAGRPKGFGCASCLRQEILGAAARLEDVICRVEFETLVRHRTPIR